jgi:hypothetical protein
MRHERSRSEAADALRDTGHPVNIECRRKMTNFRQVILCMVLAVAGCSDRAQKAGPGTAYNPRVPQKISKLTDSDLARLAEQEASVTRLLNARYPEAKLKHDEDDLRWLQRLVDEKAVGPTQTYELQCLGAALGQVFATKTLLRWVVVEDESGRDLALEYPGTSVIVFPLTMISKRVEDGRDVDVIPLYRTVVAQVEKMKDDPEYKRENTEPN